MKKLLFILVILIAFFLSAKSGHVIDGSVDTTMNNRNKISATVVATLPITSAYPSNPILHPNETEAAHPLIFSEEISIAIILLLTLLSLFILTLAISYIVSCIFKL